MIARIMRHVYARLPRIDTSKVHFNSGPQPDIPQPTPPIQSREWNEEHASISEAIVKYDKYDEGGSESVEVLQRITVERLVRLERSSAPPDDAKYVSERAPTDSADKGTK